MISPVPGVLGVNLHGHTSFLRTIANSHYDMTLESAMPRAPCPSTNDAEFDQRKGRGANICVSVVSEISLLALGCPLNMVLATMRLLIRGIFVIKISRQGVNSYS